tara:strand:- start:193 stop:717 length:525 start_codon:yes stop_codon:yes gene_type:complete
MSALIGKLTSHLSSRIVAERRKTQPASDLAGFSEWCARTLWNYIKTNLYQGHNLQAFADALNLRSEQSRQQWFVTDERLDFHCTYEPSDSWHSLPLNFALNAMGEDVEPSTTVNKKEYATLLRLHAAAESYLKALRSGHKQFTPQPRLNGRSALQCLQDMSKEVKAVTQEREDY